jgi:N-acetylneuraminate synthase/sialic acid synthase
MNLNVVQTYIKEFPEAVIGISDHDNGIAMSLVAYVLGARVIEKHFTMNRAWRGIDHDFSLEPKGMRKLVRDVHRAGIAMDDGVKRMYEKEKGPKNKMGKKIVAARNLPAGHEIRPGDLAFKSPGDGLAPYLDVQFYGKKLKVAEDEGLKTDHV